MFKRLMSKSYTFEDFERLSKEVHGNKYEYFKDDYVDWYTRTKIVCPIHGEFSQKPIRHVTYGRGCRECGREIAAKHNIERCAKLFKEKATKIHNGKYDYSVSIYKRNDIPLDIICPIHGVFPQTPNNHLSGQGCPVCRNLLISQGKRKDIEMYIYEANIVHNGKYSYDKTIYDGSSSIITITCPIHGDFEQEANSHLQGHGCPKCNKSHLEEEVSSHLNGIEYKEQKTFEWLKHKSNLYLDFFIPKYNIAIECQGMQHFAIVEHFGGKELYETRIERDKLKKELCEEHGIEVIYFTHEKVEGDYLGKVFTDVNGMIEYIKSKEQQ